MRSGGVLGGFWALCGFKSLGHGGSDILSLRAQIRQLDDRVFDCRGKNHLIDKDAKEGGSATRRGKKKSRRQEAPGDETELEEEEGNTKEL